MNIGIIGAGLIGNKRAQTLVKFKDDSILSVADVNKEKAKSLGQFIGCEYFTDPKEIIDNPKIDAVIVSTRSHLE